MLQQQTFKYVILIFCSFTFTINFNITNIKASSHMQNQNAHTSVLGVQASTNYADFQASTSHADIQASTKQDDFQAGTKQVDFQASSSQTDDFNFKVPAVPNTAAYQVSYYNLVCFAI